MRTNKSMKKKMIITAVVLAILAGIGIGIYFFVQIQNDKKSVEVLPVSQIYTTYWGDETYSSGNATSDYIQEIYPDDSKTIDEVFVKQGDTVQIGDKLLQYDKQKLEFNVERKELELKTKDNEITTAQKQLKKLQNTTPGSSATTRPSGTATPRPGTTPTPRPTPKPSTSPKPSPSPSPVPPATVTLYSEIVKDAVPYAGTGTSDDPYLFLCKPECTISPEFMRQLLGIEPMIPNPENPSETELRAFAATFEVRESNSNFGKILQSFTIDGTKLSSGFVAAAAQAAAQTAASSSETEEGLPIRELETQMEAYAATPTPTPTPKPSEDNYNSEQYTSDQLKQLISEKKEEIANLQLERKQIQLDLNKANLLLKNSTILSTVDGVVRSLTDLDTAKAEGKPFLTVSGENAFYLHGTISETLLGSIHVGDEIFATSWETGRSYSAQIVAIDDYPVDSSGYYGSGNPNSSNYQFTAVMNETEGVYNGLWLEITISAAEEGASEALYISKMYVRSDDGGSYAMKAGPDGRLVKQYLEVGKSIYSGYYIEIKYGLTMEDYIAFPYGKDVKEGVRTRLTGSEESEYFLGEGAPEGDASGADVPEGEISIPEGNSDGAADDGDPGLIIGGDDSAGTIVALPRDETKAVIVR